MTAEKSERFYSQPEVDFELEEREVRDELYEAVSTYLFNRDLIDITPDQNGEDRMVVDISRVKDAVAKFCVSKNAAYWNEREEFLTSMGTRVASVLATVFEDQEVFDAAKIEEQGVESKPKPLVYAPSAEDALDIEKIKSAEFHLAPWDITEKPNAKSPHFSEIDAEGNTLNYYEKAVALLVYGKNYGDGFRDESGRLLVYHPTRDDYQPISTEWFKSVKDFGGPEGNLSSNPHKFLELITPRLIEADLLRTDDFAFTSMGERAQTHRVERSIGVKTGSVMIDGIRYYIGKAKQFAGGQVIKLSPDTAGVIITNPKTGEETISHTFKLRDRDDPELAPYSSGKNTYYQANKKVTGLQPFDYDNIKLGPGESAAQFEERRTLLENATLLLEFSERLSREAKINLSFLDLAEQRVITANILSMKESPEEVMSFAKEYGYAGVRTFLAHDLDRSVGNQLLKFANDPANKEIGHFLFEKYSTILDARDEAYSYMEKNLPIGTLASLDDISSNLAGRGAKLLSTYARRYESGEQLDPETVRRELAAIESTNESFLAVFKALSPEDRVRALHEARGMAYDFIRGGDMDQQDVEAIEDMYRDNYPGPKYEQFCEEIISKFSASTRDPNAEFILLRKDGVLRGSMRFIDTGDNTIHFGAFNVDPNFSGSALGETLMLEELDTRAQQHVIEAETVANSKIGMHYIERGFVGTGYIMFGGVKLMEIVRDDAHSANWKFKGMAKDEIVERSLELQQTDPDRFAVSAKKQDQLDVEKRFDQGFTLTRNFFDAGTNLFYATFER